ncbi:RND transporter [bacterium]|nr:RND transporter [bacterium]
MKRIETIPWNVVIILCLTLGLAPFAPPHVYEKLQMLFNGELKRTIDWFDLILHGSPWVLLLVKMVLHLRPRADSGKKTNLEQ